MQYRKLGSTGLQISSLGLGTSVTFGSQISDEMAEKIATFAYENGINVFDTAEFYADGRAEKTLGKILKKKTWNRSSYIVCTKVLRHGNSPTEQSMSRKRIIEGILGSLERLQLEYIDILLVSRDPERSCSIEEIVRACSFIVNQGWAFYWGTANWSPDEIMEAHAASRLFNLIPPSTESLEYNMFHREFHEYGMAEVCDKLGLGLISGSPLAQGILSGKYEEGIPQYARASLAGQRQLQQRILSKEGQEQQSQVSHLSQLSSRLGFSVPQLAIAWCLKSTHINCVMMGVATVDQLQENLEAISAVSALSPTVLGEIENILLSDHQSEEDAYL